MKKRFTTKVFSSRADRYCSCDRVAGENCKCGSSGWIDYKIWDRKLKRFTRHRATEWRRELIKKVKKLNAK